MNEPESKTVRNSRAVKSAIILPSDANTMGTVFGGKVMAYVDDMAGISAMRHSRTSVVTASTDSVDFLHPIKVGHSICLESFVTWTRNTSMEVFVKVVGEDLMTGARKVCATAFLTMVAVNEKGEPCPVPPIIPGSDFEKKMHLSAPERAMNRMKRREGSKALAKEFGATRPWEQGDI